MTKIKSVKEYRQKVRELGKEGRLPLERASPKQKDLEAETADYAQRLHNKETKGRPKLGIEARG